MVGRVLGVAVLAALLVALGGQAAQASGYKEEETTLEGEMLLASATDFLGTSELSGTCEPTGDSTFEFTVTGEAFGPYPGTFTETGTFTLGPAITLPTGPITFTPLTFESTFTIVSGSTTIEGTQEMTAMLPFPANRGRCGPEFLGNDALEGAAELVVQTSYTAEIDTPSGALSDSGTSDVDYSDYKVRDLPDFQSYRFVESYTSN